MISLVPENCPNAIPNYFNRDNSMSRFNNSIYFFKVLSLSIPCAIHCIVFSSWILTRSSINSLTWVAVGITVFNNESFVKKRAVSGGKAVHYAAVGMSGLFLSLIHPSLGMKAFNIKYNASAVSNTKLPNKITKKEKTLIYIWKRMVEDCSLFPHSLLTATANAFWFTSRTCINMVTYSLLGTKVMTVQANKRKIYRELRKISRLFTSLVPTLLLSFCHPSSACHFYEKYHPIKRK